MFKLLVLFVLTFTIAASTNDATESRDQETADQMFLTYGYHPGMYNYGGVIANRAYYAPSYYAVRSVIPVSTMPYAYYGAPLMDNYYGYRYFI